MSRLNDAIRDILNELAEADGEASNREVADEVKRRHPDTVAELGDMLSMAALVARIRSLRKRGPPLRAAHSAQLVLPAMAKELAPRLPAEIPRYPAEMEPVVDSIFDVAEHLRDLYTRVEEQWHLKDDAFEEDEIPWGVLWTSTIAQVKRYAKKLDAGIRADDRRLQAIMELLEMAAHHAAGDDARLIDAVQLVPQA